ncbi:MAG TPA: hemerythrin domain-containing protein, partial [Gemmatimonadales bacterium]|nr:hemerythrin domain-containing protein [Gemmatimonadales bacterium]
MDTTAVLGRISPSITKMIRMDHSHTLLTAHKFTADAPPDKKKAVVTAVCRALEVHAQLEEEIFYPALRQAGIDDEALRKAQPEHDEVKRMIGELRAMAPADPRYDDTFATMMRHVMHHVADEEGVLLPLAEKRLAAQLSELGARMTQRRLQLVAPHVGEMATATARAMPASTMLVAGGLLT